MAYTVINKSNETIIFDVVKDGQTIWTSDKLAPGDQLSEQHRGSFGIAEHLTIQVPQYDPHGNPHGTAGWGGVLVHRDGYVTIYGSWSFDIRRTCEDDTDQLKG